MAVDHRHYFWMTICTVEDDGDDDDEACGPHEALIVKNK